MREDVDRFFAEHYLGMEYWESAICKARELGDRGTPGFAYVDTRTGLAAVAAHVEGSMSDRIENPNGSVEYLYKITFNVKNGDWEHDPRALEEMRFNLELRGQRTVQLYRQRINISKGDSFGREGNNPIVQYSRYRYDKICIIFQKVSFAWALDGNELCNDIMEPQTEPTILEIQQAADQQNQQQQQNEVNDF